MRFTYENQGTETMLVWKLEEGEHLDSLAKGMLQGNEIDGILRPAFLQRDRDQYLKYPVTSKITLEDYTSGVMEKETLLKVLISFAGAVKEISDYMLSQEKLVFCADYVFVDIRKKTVGLVYLPIDEFAQDVSLKEFLTGLISQMRFKEEEDLSYVAKLLTFLNQPDPWEAESLQHYLEQLLIEKRPSRQEQVIQKKEVSVMQESKIQPAIPEEPRQAVASAPQPAFSSAPQAVVPPVIPSVPKSVESQAIPPVIPGVPQNIPMSSVPSNDLETDKKKKEKHLIDLFKKPAKKKDSTQAAEVKQPEPEKKKEKKSLFGKEKKKKDKAPIVPEMPVFGNIPSVKPEEPINLGIQVPSQEERRDNPPENRFFREEIRNESPVQVEQYENTGYAGHGSSEEEEHTVIMGGAAQEQSTVILGSGEQEQKKTEDSKYHSFARLIRRRTGQSMILDKGSLRIGSEGSFVDFYIADNPAIGGCHADIVKKDEEWYLTDRNSANHTYLNGRQIVPMQATKLDNNDTIRLADEDFEFYIN